MTYKTEIHTEFRQRAWSVEVVRDWPNFLATAPLHRHVTPASMERLRRWLIAQLEGQSIAALEVTKHKPSLLYDARISYVLEWRKPNA